jgi:hypothetical protein
LQRRSTRPDLVLSQSQVRQRLPRGDAELRRHQVNIGDLFSHSVFYLDPWIHLDENVLAAPVEQKLNCARAAVANLPGERHGVSANAFTQNRIQFRRGRQLDDLLVAALYATVALVEMDYVAVGIGQNLHLDVTGVDHRLLQENSRVAEGRPRLAASGFDRLGQCGRVGDLPQPAAAATGNSLDENREFHCLSGG